MLSHPYNIAIDCGVGTPGHGKYSVYGLNANDNMFLTMLMTTVQLPGAATTDSYMVIHTVMSITDMSLSRLFQRHISYPTRAYELLDHVNDRK